MRSKKKEGTALTVKKGRIHVKDRSGEGNILAFNRRPKQGGEIMERAGRRCSHLRNHEGKLLAGVRREGR